MSTQSGESTPRTSGVKRWLLPAAFFVVGGVGLARVDMRTGITDAGNALPSVV